MQVREGNLYYYFYSQVMAEADGRLFAKTSWHQLHCRARKRITEQASPVQGRGSAIAAKYGRSKRRVNLLPPTSPGDEEEDTEEEHVEPKFECKLQGLYW